MKRSFLAICFLFICSLTYSQSFERAIGIRFGGIDGQSAGFDYKQFMSDSTAVEAIVSVGGIDGMSYFVGTGLYEWHIEAFSNDQWTWSYGVGARIVTIQTIGLGAGIAAVGGLDFKPNEIPVSFSVNFIPDLMLASGLRYSYGDLALTIRYVIN